MTHDNDINNDTAGPSPIDKIGDRVPPDPASGDDYPGLLVENDDSVQLAENSDNVSSYPGGKGGAGVYQTIINLIPPHDIYIETHLGGGAIMRHKKPARISVGIDIDPGVIDNHGDKAGIITVNDDVMNVLPRFEHHKNVYIYCDPPYLMETRKSGKLYNFEYTRQQHVELLQYLLKSSHKIMISGYFSDLYNEILSEWNTRTFKSVTRGGTVATEWVWFNYPEPTELHDYSYLGNTFRERERIKRKRNRWIKRLLSMPTLERSALLNALNESVSSIDKNNGGGLHRHKQRSVRDNNV